MSIKWIVHNGKNFNGALEHGVIFARWLTAYECATAGFERDGKERFIYRVEMSLDESVSGLPLGVKQSRRMGSLQGRP